MKKYVMLLAMLSTSPTIAMEIETSELMGSSTGALLAGALEKPDILPDELQSLMTSFFPQCGENPQPLKPTLMAILEKMLEKSKESPKNLENARILYQAMGGDIGLCGELNTIRDQWFASSGEKKSKEVILRRHLSLITVSPAIDQLILFTKRATAVRPITLASVQNVIDNLKRLEAALMMDKSDPVRLFLVRLSIQTNEETLRNATVVPAKQDVFQDLLNLSTLIETLLVQGCVEGVLPHMENFVAGLAPYDLNNSPAIKITLGKYRSLLLTHYSTGAKDPEKAEKYLQEITSELSARPSADLAENYRLSVIIYLQLGNTEKVIDNLDLLLQKRTTENLFFAAKVYGLIAKGHAFEKTLKEEGEAAFEKLKTKKERLQTNQNISESMGVLQGLESRCKPLRETIADIETEIARQEDQEIVAQRQQKIQKMKDLLATLEPEPKLLTDARLALQHKDQAQLMSTLNQMLHEPDLTTQMQGIKLYEMMGGSSVIVTHFHTRYLNTLVKMAREKTLKGTMGEILKSVKVFETSILPHKLESMNYCEKMQQIFTLFETPKEMMTLEQREKLLDLALDIRIASSDPLVCFFIEHILEGYEDDLLGFYNQSRDWEKLLKYLNKRIANHSPKSAKTLEELNALKKQMRKKLERQQKQAQAKAKKTEKPIEEEKAKEEEEEKEEISAEAILERANALVEMRNYQEAAPLFEALGNWRIAGRCYYMSGNYAKAASVFEGKDEQSAAMCYFNARDMEHFRPYLAKMVKAHQNSSAPIDLLRVSEFCKVAGDASNAAKFAKLAGSALNSKSLTRQNEILAEFKSEKERFIDPFR